MQTRWKLRFFCLLLCVFATSIDANEIIDTSDSAQQEPLPDKCGGDITNYAELLAKTKARKRPPAAQQTVPREDPTKFQPFKVLYALVGGMLSQSIATKNKMKHIAMLASVRIQTLVRGPVLTDIRSLRIIAADGVSCEEPTCRGPIPGIYVQPCVNPQTGQHVPEPGVYLQPTSDVDALAKKNWSLVVYLDMVPTNDPRAAYCAANSLVGFTATCDQDLTTLRPTHGRLVICKDLSNYHDEYLENILLHETLHIMTASRLSGDFHPSVIERVSASATTLEEYQVAGRNFAWTTVPLNWINEDGTTSQVHANVTITRHVADFVKGHFNCPAVKGAELSVGDNGHWSMRLFPDDILAPAMRSGQRFSNLTLSVLKDTSWYDVDFRNAEPLSISRPREMGCQVATQSCHQILKAIRDKNDKSVKLIGPYCDPNERVLTHHCSADGKIRLDCIRYKSVTRYCYIRDPFEIISQPNSSNSYDHPICHLAKVQTEQNREVGFSVLPNGRCFTLLDYNFTKVASKDPQAECFDYDCLRDSKILARMHSQLPWDTSPNRQHYAMALRICEKADSNKVIPFTVSTGVGKLICPDYDDFCPLRSSAIGPTASSASSSMIKQNKVIFLTAFGVSVFKISFCKLK